MRQLISKANIAITFTIGFLFIVLIISDYNFRWKNEKWKWAINSDGYDYYRYLPMVFIDRHPDKEITPTEQKPIIKHYVGAAILFLPFFTVAYTLSTLFHYPLDGFSILFQISIGLATLFYLLWGIYYLFKFLRFYLIPDWIICLVLLSVVLATNVFYYTVLISGWSHVLSFSMISFFLYHQKKLFENFNKQSLFFCIVFLSIIFWTRPTDITIILVIPFLANDSKHFFQTIKKVFVEKKIIFFSLLVALLPALCQFYMYYLQTGHFIVWSYTNERFNFLRPEISNVLFSYAKGFFVYTPICFIALFGLVVLFKQNRYLFWGVLLYIAVNIYIVSSWWCWNYGFCYGSRAFIDHYSLFVLLLALCIKELKLKAIKIIVIAIVILTSPLNWIQMYQFEKGILDNDFRTDKKGYWSVFLKTDRGYSGKFYRYQPDTSLSNIQQKHTYFNDMEKPDSSWVNNSTLIKEKAHSGRFSSKANNKSNYSIGFIKEIDKIPYSKNVLIQISGWFYLSGKGSDTYFAIAFTNNGNMVNFSPFGLDKYMDQYNHWEYQTFELYMPKLSQEQNSEMRLYLCNTTEVNAYVDDLKIEITEFKKFDRILDIWWD